MDRHRRIPHELYVFLSSLVFVWWLAGNRLIITNDEGAFLAQAARVAQGEVLYRDLVGLTGPGCFWLIAVFFKVFGTTLSAAHMILTLEIALLTTLIFFVTRRLSNTESAVAGALAFLILTASDPAIMTNNHRWDADTYAFLGVVAIWLRRPLLGGVLLALSVWATPIFALTALTAVAAAWLLQIKPWRIIAGGAIGAAGGLAALALNGALMPYIRDLLWMKDNYSGVNKMPYGSVIGGYPALFEGASSAFEWGFRAFLVFGLTVPLWLPPLCVAIVAKTRDRERAFFLLCGLSMVLGVSPRYDIGHLVFAAPLFYPIAASYLDRARWAVVPVGAVALLFLFSAVINRIHTQEVETPFGTVRTDADSAEIVRWLTANVKPGEPVFIYPYPPVFYTLSGARNISRYSYLHPGFSNQHDERLVIEDMKRDSPSKILFMDIPPDKYLRMFPSSDPDKLRLRLVDDFVTGHFQKASRFRNFEIYTPKQLSDASLRP